jgi:hypothetical protein
LFKNKMYVYGLGVGLIVGAILLQLMNIALHNNNPQAYANTRIEELDPNKLKEQASKYFQVFDQKVKVFSQSEFDNELKKSVQEEKDKFAAANPTPATTASKRTVVYIQPNLPASSVTEILFKSGVVSDRIKLEEELVKQQATNKIQVGYHIFEGAPDLQQVIANLQKEQ